MVTTTMAVVEVVAVMAVMVSQHQALAMASIYGSSFNPINYGGGGNITNGFY